MSLVICTKGHQVSLGVKFCHQCGDPLPKLESKIAEASRSENELEELPIGTQLRDRYLIQQQLGQGGFGRTYLAEDTGRFHEKIAIKEFLPTVQGTQALEKAEELFQREAVTLHQLQHPQIPRFWETFREGKRLFLVEDFIEGQTYESLLEQRLRKGKCFNEAEILQLFCKLLPVLSYLHRQGVIHRDISPDNIMLRPKDNQVVLIDMGGVKQVAIDVVTQLAGVKNRPTSSKATCLGKVGYAPDEQLRLGIVAPHSDLYALAVTAIVLMTGKQPQELLDQRTLHWLWHQELSLSPLLTKILNRMLNRQPSQRFKSADEIIQLLQSNPSNRTYAATKPTEVKVSAPVSNSGEGCKVDTSIKVPDEPKGWNWAISGCLFITIISIPKIARIYYFNQKPEPQRVESVDPSPVLSSPPVASSESSPSLPTSTKYQFQKVEIGQLKTYTYPGSLFSIKVPTGWRLKDTSESGEAIITWIDQTKNSFIQVNLFATEKNLTQDELSNVLQTVLVNLFESQQDFNLDVPQIQKDDSVRITWSFTVVASNGIKAPILGNSFISKQNDKISMTSYVVPAEQFSELEDPINQIINSYTANSSAPLP